tara:strand:+ start:254 stop:463 length:210 start_codon:yes stop_codon:yes gene_type:complete
MLNIQDIFQLSAAERLLLMEKIWDSIDPKDIENSEAHKQELDRRLSRYNKGETNFVSWDSIKKDLRNRK